MDMVIKEISKTHFVTRSGTIMWKREKKNVKILANKMKVYIIFMIVKAIWVVLVVHQSILQIIETHFAYEDGDFDYDHIDATYLDIIIFFAKPNGSINHLIGYEGVKKKIISYWYLRLYEERMLTLIPMMGICVLLIVQQLIQFSRVIMFSLVW